MSINFWKIAQGINLAPKTSAPSSPANGDMYYNSTTNLFQFYQNGAFTAFGDVLNGGNSFGAAMRVGTNDAFDLILERANVTSLTVSTSGGLPFVSSTGKMELGAAFGAGGGTAGVISIAEIGSSTTSFLTGDRNIGVKTAFTSTSSATHASLAVVGMYSGVTTAAASFTAPVRYQYYSDVVAKGSGSTITRDIGLYVGQANQGTNNAAITNNITFTGDWFLHSTSTAESLLTGRWLTLNPSSAGDAGLLINNTNAGSGANAEIELTSLDAGAGDPKVRFNIGGGVQSWAIGIDNSDSDNFKISNSGVIGTNTGLTINTSLLIGLSSAIDTNTLVNVLNNGALTGTSQRGITVGFAGSSNATAEVVGFRSETGTAAAAFTAPIRAQYYARSITKGAGSTITRDIKYWTDGATSQATNNAQFADNTSFSGDYLAHFADTRAFTIGGRFSAFGDPVASVMITAGGGTNAMTQTDQRAFGAFLTSTSNATDSTQGFYSSVTTAATAYTTTLRAQFNATNPTKGAGSTITRDINYLGAQVTQGTNNAFLADNTAFTGSFFINQSGTNASSFGGKILHPDGASNAPSISFSSQSTLGFYRVGTDSVRFVGSDDTFFGIWNAGTNDSSVLVLENNGSSTGDQYVYFKEGGVTADQWSLGRDDSDSGAFVLSQASSPGTNNFLKITTVGNVITAGALAQTSYDTATPTTGQTVTASANKPGVLITPAGTLATLTIKLPSSPIDGQRYWVASSQQLTSVTWQDAGGTAGNVIGGQTTIGGTNRSQEFVYSLANTKWYAIS